MSNIHRFPGRGDAPGAPPAFGVSPRFIPFLAAFVASGFALWSGIATHGLAVFVFVVSGWIVSLCLHEFGHAIIAYRGGDYGVRDRGYLTLDPLSYTQPMLSIVLPVLFLAIGAIGLPGGAVYVDRSRLRSRQWDSLVSLGGPAATLAFFIMIATPFLLGLYRGAEPGQISGTPQFWAAMAMLAYIQAMALVFNLLPLPGFDGFGALAMFMSRETEARLLAFAQPVLLLFILAIIVVPQVLRPLQSVALWLTGSFDVPIQLVGLGLSLFRFWN